MSGLSICKFWTGPGDQSFVCLRPLGLKCFLSWDNPAGLQEIAFPNRASGGCPEALEKVVQSQDRWHCKPWKGRGSYLWILCTLDSQTPTPTKAPMMTMQAASFAHQLIGRSRILKSSLWRLETLKLKVSSSKWTNCWLSHRIPNLTGRRTKGPSGWCQWTTLDSSSGNIKNWIVHLLRIEKQMKTREQHETTGMNHCTGSMSYNLIMWPLDGSPSC